MAKNGQFWSFDLKKNFLRFERNLWSLSTGYKGLICAISSKWYDWDSKKS